MLVLSISLRLRSLDTPYIFMMHFDDVERTHSFVELIW